MGNNSIITKGISDEFNWAFKYAEVLLDTDVDKARHLLSMFGIAIWQALLRWRQILAEETSVFCSNSAQH